MVSSNTRPNLLDSPHFCFKIFRDAVELFGFPLLKVMHIHDYLTVLSDYIFEDITAGFRNEFGRETKPWEDLGLTDNSFEIDYMETVVNELSECHPFDFFIGEIIKFREAGNRRRFIEFVTPMFHLPPEDTDRFIEFTCHVNRLSSSIKLHGYGKYPVPSTLRNPFEIPGDFDSSMHLIWKMYKDFMKYGHPTQIRIDPNQTVDEIQKILDMNMVELRVRTQDEIAFFNRMPTPGERFEPAPGERFAH